MTTSESFSAYLDRLSSRHELQMLRDGQQEGLSVDDLISALQRADRVALAFDLAFGNWLYVTRTGVGEYHAVFVPRDTDESDLQGPRAANRSIIAFYNDLAPVQAVDVTETPLASLHDSGEGRSVTRQAMAGGHL